MTRRLLLTTLAVTAAVPVAAADAAKPAPYPSVSNIEPLNLGIGDTMTITGKNFVRGTRKNTVVFKRDGKRALFVKADTATKTKLTFRIPESLRKALGKKNGVAVPSKFRVRVLSRRFAKRYSAKDKSPIIAPRSIVEVLRVEEAKAIAVAEAQRAANPAPAPVTPPPPPDCDGDGVLDADDSDDDNDLLTDAFELSIKTNGCSKDSDGDGMWDIWEYEAAIDLNSRALPYPGKRPHPNPLDGSDARMDWDGDGLFSDQEHALWRRFGQGRPLPLNYSDGLKMTGPEVPAPTAVHLKHLDQPNWNLEARPIPGTTGDGKLDDGEKDADGDRLSNWSEMNGTLTDPWWKAVKPYSEETPYFNRYDSTDWAQRDSDGDGLSDGSDDQDFDGWSNVSELERWYTGWFVHPFNPCLPNPASERCSRYIPADLDKPYPPFNGERWYENAQGDRVLEDLPLQWPRPSSHPDALPEYQYRTLEQRAAAVQAAAADAAVRP